MIINDKRALAYTTKISWVKPIEGADNIELIGIQGWTCIAKIGEFKEGDLCVYFEIDSKLPENADWAAFLAPKKFKVKTMKLNKFKVISQGLALPYDAFEDIELPTEENVDMTERLGVTYIEPEDNDRKANISKEMSMKARHPKVFKSKWGKWMMRHEFTRKIMYAVFGRKKSGSEWPEGVVKTDEERVQNMPWVLFVETPFIATEKIDGTSATYHVKRIKKGKYKTYVCSRNVVQTTPDRPCYYDDNVYWKIEKKYNILNKMTKYCEEFNCDWLTIQGEIYGKKIQKRDYSLDDIDFAVFNFITPTKTFNPIEIHMMCEDVFFNLPTVPIVNDNYYLPDTVEEVLEFADGMSALDGKVREGIVFRNTDGLSFKAVSNKYLLKYHS